MKIVQVVHGFPPQQIGSIENYTQALSRELVADHHEVGVYTRDSNFSLPDYAESEELTQGVRLHRINNRLEFPHYYDYENAFVASSFRKFLNVEKPDMVHIQHLMGLSASLIRTAREFGVPVTMTLHDYWLVCRRMSLLRPNLEGCTGPGAKKCQDCRFRELERLIFPRLGRAALQHLPDGLVESIAAEGAVRRFNGSSSWPDRYLTAHISRTRYLQMVMNQVNLFISPSEFVRSVFIEQGVPGGKIISLPSGVLEGNIGLVQKKPSQVLRFGYMGTVDWHKGVHVLVEAFNQLRGEPVELTVYGLGPSTYLEHLRSINRNEKTKLLGIYADPTSILSVIDALVIPSICYESYSLAMREAFLAHTPVIASRRGALPEGIVDGRNGLLFEPGNAQDLLSKVKLLLVDPSMIHEMSDRAPQVKTMRQHALEVEAVYKCIEEEHASSHGQIRNATFRM